MGNDLSGLIEAPLPVAGSGRKASPPKQKSLAELKAALGLLLVPRYLPDGFSLLRAQLTGERTSDVTWHVTGTLDQPKGPLLVITQCESMNLKVLSGFQSEIQVGGGPAHLVRGTWVITQGERGQTITGWQANLTTAIVLERFGWVAKVACIPGNALSEAELGRVAESLEPS